MQYLKNSNVALFVHLAEKKCHNLCAKCSLNKLPARLVFQLFYIQRLAVWWTNQVDTLNQYWLSTDIKGRQADLQGYCNFSKKKEEKEEKEEKKEKEEKEEKKKKKKKKEKKKNKKRIKKELKKKK